MYCSLAFFAHDLGPFEHFQIFEQSLQKDVTLYVFSTARNRSEEKGLPYSKLSWEDFPPYSAYLCDIATPQSEISRIRKRAPDAYLYLYYDNLEQYVPGGYSKKFAELVEKKEIDGVVFANSRLMDLPLFSAPGKEISLEGKELLGLGYFPLEQAEAFSHHRDLFRHSLRENFCCTHQLSSEKERVFVYFGGNNREYLEHALPAFCKYLRENRASLKETTWIYQQHPGARNHNLDLVKIQPLIADPSLSFYLSRYDLSDVCSLADAAFYYQTSMAAQFALAGIPVAQIGHDTYPDILTRNALIPSITSSSTFERLLTSATPEVPPKDLLLRLLGADGLWKERLQFLVEKK